MLCLTKKLKQTNKQIFILPIPRNEILSNFSIRSSAATDLSLRTLRASITKGGPEPQAKFAMRLLRVANEHCMELCHVSRRWHKGEGHPNCTKNQHLVLQIFKIWLEGPNRIKRGKVKTLAKDYSETELLAMDGGMLTSDAAPGLLNPITNNTIGVQYSNRKAGNPINWC